MIAKVYAHSFDDDRKSIAQKFDDAFYGGSGFDQPKAIPKSDPATVAGNMDMSALVSLIQANPQLVHALQAAIAPAT